MIRNLSRGAFGEGQRPFPCLPGNSAPGQPGSESAPCGERRIDAQAIAQYPGGKAQHHRSAEDRENGGHAAPVGFLEAQAGQQIALALPKLELLRAEVRALGPDTWRVRFAVANAGYLPAYVTKRALERKTARGTVFTIHLPPGVTLVSGRERVEGAHLEGHAPKSSQQAFLPSREITGDRAVVEWVVNGARGTRIALTATADRAGTVRTEVTLD